LLLSLPPKRDVLLLVPLTIAWINCGGVLFHYVTAQWAATAYMKEALAPHRGGTVLLEESIFEYESLFDRYDLKQKFINPEEVLFFRHPGLGFFTGLPDGAVANMFFPEDLPSPPPFPLRFSDPAASPWLEMSEGVAPAMDYTLRPPRERWKSYDDKIKFYMRLDEAPGSDWLVTLTGGTYGPFYPKKETLSVWVFVNNTTIGHWTAMDGGNQVTLRIPRHLLEESFQDPTGLFTLMLRMPEAPFKGGADSPFGLELRELYLRPASGDVLSEAAS
jgi:hypothetical protein